MMTHLDETQTMLRDSVQAFHERHPGPARTRRLRNEAIPFDRSVWRDMAEAGWSGVMVPESLGGHGLGAAEAMLIACELGRGLAPEPYVASGLMVVQALVPIAADSAPARALLEQVLAGQTLVALAWQEAAGKLAIDDIRMRAVREGEGWQLEGATKRFVPLADAAVPSSITDVIIDVIT